MKSRMAFVFGCAAVGAIAACGTDDNGHDHRELERAVILDRGQTAPTEVAEWQHGEGWSSDSALPTVGVGDDGRISLGVEVYDETGTQLIDASGDISARYALSAGADDGVLDLNHPDDDIFHSDHVHIYGQAEGTTEIEFVLWHGDHSHGETSPIEVTVSDDGAAR